MIRQALLYTFRALRMFVTGDPYAVRQGMNATHAFGMTAGRLRKWREEG
jgi:hypothetical protein